MQTGNATVGSLMPEKMPVQQQQQWFSPQQVDERDGFISWLRGEFAASNAIIDALCHHLRLVGEAGEYDGVISCVQQRRGNWSSVLHMQQYFSVAEVIYSLHQVEWRKQQKGFDGGGVGKGGKRNGGGRGGGAWRNEGGKDGKESQGQNFTMDGYGKTNGVEKIDVVEVKQGEKKELVGNPEANSSLKSSVCTESSDSQGEVDKTDDKHDSNSEGSSTVENESHSIQIPTEKQNVVPKTFDAKEMHDGKPVNVVEGMKLYEELLNSSEVSKLGTLVNDLRAAGRRGQLPAQTFIISKRPMKGHGREMIQLGLPVDAPPEDEAAISTYKDRKTEAIPGLFQDVIDRLSAMQVLSTKPDACVIDIFNEGDHSQPQLWPYWYGRPISVLFLTDCEMTFGKVINVDHPGDYRGSLKLSFAPGSILVMQGRSTEFVKYAIPSIRKQRILVTFTKLQPRRIKSGDSQRFPSSAAGGPVPQWVPPSRSPNHMRRPFGPKHYGSMPTTGVLPVPAVRPQLAPASIQPIFVPAAIAPAMPFPAPVALPPASAGWAAPPPRHPPPRLPLPGTGVFLPPGSGPSVADNILAENPTSSEKENAAGSLGDSTVSQKDITDSSEVQTQECNGKVDANHAEKAVADEERH